MIQPEAQPMPMPSRARVVPIVATVGLTLGAGCGLIGYGDSAAPPTPGACFPSIAIGEDHTCVVNRAGRVFCWGMNDHGQVTGAPGGGIRSTPVEVPLAPAGTATAVAAGPLTSCALGDRDVLACWGAQSGTTPPADYPEPRRLAFPADDPAYRIGLGQEFGCAKVGPDDHVACWGTGTTQRLGQADTVAHPTPVAVPGPVGLFALAVGQRAACALQGDGTTWCWGDNRRGQLALGVADPARGPTEVSGLAGVDAVALGDDVGCALQAGSLRCWGGNDLGQLGAGTFGMDARVPGAPLATGVQAVATMGSAACTLGDDHAVRCWGQNRSGELGLGDLTVRSTPTEVVALRGARSIAAGYHQACAEKDDQLFCWGDNLTGQLGRGNAATDSNLRPMMAGTPFRQVKGGGGTLCAIDAQFRLWCWGDGERGQLGVGDLRGTVAPAMVMPGPVREVAVGSVHVCARGDTTLWCWGANGAGQLGDPALGLGALMPRIIIDGASLSGLAAGNAHTCAIASGVVKCWGNNDFGQIGTGNTTPQPTPFVVALTQPTRIAVGAAHSCAIANGGQLWCWGAGAAGQLGDGRGLQSNTPVQVVHPNAKAWVSVAAGRLHTCAVDDHTVMWCWGDNTAGQLGSMGGGAVAPRAVDWPGGAVTREVFIRQDTTCATSTTGETRCWGADGFGALPPGGPIPRPFGTFADFTTYGGGLYDLCAVRMNGELWCAGAGDRGQLGADLVGWTPAPVAVPCD